MTAKEFLSQAFTLDRQIKAKRLQIQRLRDMQYSVSGTLSPDKVQTSPNPDRMGEITAAVVDLRDEYAKDVTRLLRLKYDIKKMIEKVSNPVYRLILEERYVNLKIFEQIAVDNNYSYYHTVHRLHPQALTAIEQVIECYPLDMI